MKPSIKLIVECFVVSLVVALADFVVVYFFIRDLTGVIFYLSMALLLEGGLGLLVGGFSASLSRVFAKIGEKLFKSRSSNTSGQREVENNAFPWIVTGFWLVLLGLVVSAI